MPIPASDFLSARLQSLECQFPPASITVDDLTVYTMSSTTNPHHLQDPDGFFKTHDLDPVSDSSPIGPPASDDNHPVRVLNHPKVVLERYRSGQVHLSCGVGRRDAVYWRLCCHSHFLPPSCHPLTIKRCPTILNKMWAIGALSLPRVERTDTQSRMLAR